MCVPTKRGQALGSSGCGGISRGLRHRGVGRGGGGHSSAPLPYIDHARIAPRNPHHGGDRRPHHAPAHTRRHARKPHPYPMRTRRRVRAERDLYELEGLIVLEQRSLDAALLEETARDREGEVMQGERERETRRESGEEREKGREGGREHLSRTISMDSFNTSALSSPVGHSSLVSPAPLLSSPSVSTRHDDSHPPVSRRRCPAALRVSRRGLSPLPPSPGGATPPPVSLVFSPLRRRDLVRERQLVRRRHLSRTPPARQPMPRPAPPRPAPPRAGRRRDCVASHHITYHFVM